MSRQLASEIPGPSPEVYESDVESLKSRRKKNEDVTVDRTEADIPVAIARKDEPIVTRRVRDYKCVVGQGKLIAQTGIMELLL